MDHRPALRGIYVPLITPFTDDGKIAVEALDGLAHSALDDGATGLLALGTTAEAATLDDEEKRIVIEVCARVCRERTAPLIVGAGTNDTRSSGEALEALASWPQTVAALTPVPYFTRPTEAGVIAHFTRLAEQSPVPILIYNIPYRTARTVGVAALRRLAELPGIAGVKQAVGAVDENTVRLLGDLPPDFAVLAGDDVFVSPLLALGAHGGVLASAQLCPGRFVDLMAAWQAADPAKARALGHELARLSRALFVEPNPAVLKGVLHAEGRIPNATVRLPLLPARAESIAAAREALASLRLSPGATPGFHE